MKTETDFIALEFATNIFGILKPDIIKRIKKFMRNPTSDTWDDISGIIINGKMFTIWQAVGEIDPLFPNYGRSTDSDGNIIRDWAEVPTPEKVKEAIRKEVFKKSLVTN